MMRDLKKDYSYKVGLCKSTFYTITQFFNVKTSIFVLLIVFMTSCATASFSKYKGVGRVKTYHISSKDLPASFDGFRMAFATDFHYESKFKSSRLNGMVLALKSVNPDILLLGGDYRGRNGGNLDELFDAIEKVKPEYGTFAVMGNHERGENDTLVRKAMKRTGISLLEHETDTIYKGKDYILITGIRNPFDLKRNGISPTLKLTPSDFVVMLTHTPDYAEDTDITNTDLVLAGHTHGGQVSFFRKWTPAHFSKYGNRFLTGLKKNSLGIPVIISNGLGTSRKDIRLFTPSEIVLVVLHTE